MVKRIMVAGDAKIGHQISAFVTLTLSLSRYRERAPTRHDFSLFTHVNIENMGKD